MKGEASGQVPISATGLHILSRFFGCDFDRIASLDLEEIERQIRALVAKHGLTQVGQIYHPFGAPGAFTASVVLAESHICIHTWPEFNMVIMDVFVCNVSRDNSEAARRLHSDLEQTLFRPERAETQLVPR